MRHYVEVTKVELMDGEEMMDMAKKVMAAITQHKGKLKKSLALQGIFKDHVVVRDMESGRMFKMTMARSDAGAVELDGMEEVRQVFVPVKKIEKSAAADLRLVELPMMLVVVKDDKLDQDSISMLEEVAKTAALPEQDSKYVELPEGGSESVWRGII